MTLATLLWKDLRRELRGRESLQAAVVLVGLFLLVYLFLFDHVGDDHAVGTALVWVPMVWGAAAMAGRALGREAQEGTLDWITTAPGGRLWIGISHTIVDTALVLLLTLLTGLGAWAIFGVGAADAWMILALAGIGLALVGTLTGAVAAQARARDLLLPMLLIPVAAPLVLAGTTATRLALSGAPASALEVPLLLIAGYDLLILGASWLLWPILLEGE